MAVREKSMIDLYPRALPVINVHFDVDEEAWVVNCLSCWGDGDIPQFLGQFADRRRAVKFGDRHAHWGDMGTGMRAEAWLAWISCEACGSTFTAWPPNTHPLGGGRTHARRAHYDDFESVTIRPVHAAGSPCLPCVWVLRNIDSPFTKADFELLWVHRHG